MRPNYDSLAEVSTLGIREWQLFTWWGVGKDYNSPCCSCPRRLTYDRVLARRCQHQRRRLTPQIKSSTMKHSISFTRRKLRSFP
jgi:hypothetical protein